MKNKKNLKKIFNELDKNLYDDLSDYDKGRKDILNLVFGYEEFEEED